MKVTKIKNYIVICLFLIFVLGHYFFELLHNDIALTQL